MSELARTPTSAAAAPTVDHDHLDQLIARIAAGDRAAFRRLYAFMAMRVWHAVTAPPLCPASAVAVTRSTFVEVSHSAGAAARFDARDWIAALSTRRVNDRLCTINANGRHGVHLVRPHVTADGHNQAPTVADYDTHVHRELTALLRGGPTIIRTGPGVFARIDDLDDALDAIAAASQPAVIDRCSSAVVPRSIPPSTRQR